MKTNCHKIVQQRCYYVIWWLFEGQVFLTVGLAPIEGALESLEILALRRLASPPLFRGKNHFELTTPLLDFECMEQSPLPKVIFLWEVAWETLWGCLRIFCRENVESCDYRFSSQNTTVGRLDDLRTKVLNPPPPGLYVCVRVCVCGGVGGPPPTHTHSDRFDEKNTKMRVFHIFSWYEEKDYFHKLPFRF